jgi:hypothetical protein
MRQTGAGADNEKRLTSFTVTPAEISSFGALRFEEQVVRKTDGVCIADEEVMRFLRIA